MWVRTTMWDRSIELGEFDHWVITSRASWATKRWLDAGFTLVPQEGVWPSIHAALAKVQDRQVPALWKCLFPYRSWHPRSVWELKHELARAACDSIPHIVVLERLIERGFRFEPIVWNYRPPPPRTQTEHFVIVEAVDVDERPVHGLRVELLIADGEIKSAQTGRDGIARVERIQAGSVVIRVLGIDGNRWRPAHGASSRESNRERPSTHVVERGENLSRIARRHGLQGWKAIWDDPKNEPLRKKRKSPHVLHPGDDLHVPGLSVFEIERETDATHRIVLETYRFESDLALTLTTELATRLTPGAFALWGRAVFGADLARAGFEQLHGDLRSGGLPRVEARLSTDLQRHPAAYDSRQRLILVAEDMVLEACSDPTGYAATLACVLIEEFGHYLDDLLRRHYAEVGGDAPRDEGARFASLLLTEALATAGPVRVGTLFIDGVAHEIVADPEEIAGIVGAVLGPIQQLSDERTASREYADAGPTADHEQGEILYLSLLLAGYSILDAHALVDLARKLNARWRGTSGPAVFYEAGQPGKPSPALERLILSYLLALHRKLDQRIRDAPLTADGLPDLGGSSWDFEEGDALWEPNSPLAGLLEDIAPFGSHQEWMMRFHELDLERKARELRVRQRTSERGIEPHELQPEQAPGLGGYVSGLQGLSGAAWPMYLLATKSTRVALVRKVAGILAPLGEVRVGVRPARLVPPWRPRKDRQRFYDDKTRSVTADKHDEWMEELVMSVLVPAEGCADAVAVAKQQWMSPADRLALLPDAFEKCACEGDMDTMAALYWFQSLKGYAAIRWHPWDDALAEQVGDDATYAELARVLTERYLARRGRTNDGASTDAAVP